MHHCKNCNEPVEGKYCTHCGTPARLKRIDGHYIIHGIEHVLHLDRGILFTIKELLVRPGQSVKYFITENRTRLVKPVVFIIITSLIYTIINQLFGVTGFINFDNPGKSTANVIFKWVQEHYGYANILMGVFIALRARILFFKKEYNFFEILILLCYTIGMQMLIFSVFAILTGLTKLELMPFAGFAGIVYCTWAIGQFFGRNQLFSYVKSLALYVLGLITFSLLAVQIGNLIDLVV